MGDRVLHIMLLAISLTLLHDVPPGGSNICLSSGLPGVNINVEA
jgi:hypothetical protein